MNSRGGLHGALKPQLLYYAYDGRADAYLSIISVPKQSETRERANAKPTPLPPPGEEVLGLRTRSLIKSRPFARGPQDGNISPCIRFSYRFEGRAYPKLAPRASGYS